MTDLHTILLVAAGVLAASFCIIVWQRNRHYIAFKSRRCSPPDPAIRIRRNEDII